MSSTNEAQSISAGESLKVVTAVFVIIIVAIIISIVVIVLNIYSIIKSEESSSSSDSSSSSHHSSSIHDLCVSHPIYSHIIGTELTNVDGNRYSFTMTQDGSKIFYNRSDTTKAVVSPWDSVTGTYSAYHEIVTTSFEGHGKFNLAVDMTGRHLVTTDGFIAYSAIDTTGSNTWEVAVLDFELFQPYELITSSQFGVAITRTNGLYIAVAGEGESPDGVRYNFVQIWKFSYPDKYEYDGGYFFQTASNNISTTYAVTFDESKNRCLFITRQNNTSVVSCHILERSDSSYLNSHWHLKHIAVNIISVAGAPVLGVTSMVRYDIRLPGKSILFIGFPNFTSGTGMVGVYIVEDTSVDFFQFIFAHIPTVSSPFFGIDFDILGGETESDCIAWVYVSAEGTQVAYPFQYVDSLGSFQFVDSPLVSTNGYLSSGGVAVSTERLAIAVVKPYETIPLGTGVTFTLLDPLLV